MLGSTLTKRSDGIRYWQPKIIIAGAQIVHLDASYSVSSAPHNHSDSSTSRRRSDRIAYRFGRVSWIVFCEINAVTATGALINRSQLLEIVSERRELRCHGRTFERRLYNRQFIGRDRTIDLSACGHLKVLPNGVRLSCGAKPERSRTQVYRS